MNSNVLAYLQTLYNTVLYMNMLKLRTNHH